MTGAPEHNHTSGCRAVWFDDTGAYRGTRAFDPERCEQCRIETTPATPPTEGATHA